MATTKKNSYITAEIDFAEMQVEKWKNYLQENPYDKVVDRKELQKTKTGGSFYAVVQTKEAIQKSLRDTTKEYLAMLEVIDKLRAVDEAKKKTARGSVNIPEGMEDD
jgi:hypothetical protein